ncbi:hypothetical protein GCM10007916_29740 [Psychromonas marina]|uniref:Diguanylate cyclase n=1 Tax=Psychromonas marina TaxID=88364 RepID=A0ABQ6E3B7_9GAMM|nr:sensor domain-containing diguanylate cyclase [Psychromonas marina]GLS91904.1 hypothetical protein GCM10007916_29740 [Psychromonas marina]
MKKVTPNITLKFISIMLLSLIVLMASAQIISMLKIKSDVLKIETLWEEVQVEQSEKLRLENSIRRFLGFGGMIHKLKNAILNDNIDQLESIKSDLQSIDSIIQLYNSFQLSDTERDALKDIAAVVKQYQDNCDKLLSLFKQNAPQHKLDQFMRINNDSALRGLAVLEKYNRNFVTQNGEKQTSSPDKFILLTDLVAKLGYGGLIHHIKNYQLRADSYYANAAQESLDEVRVIVEKYLQQVLTVDEKRVLNNLVDSTDFYQQRLKQLTQPNQQVEQKNVLALNSINRKIINAIEVLNQHIEIELRSKTAEVGEKIHHIQSSIDNLIKAIIVISILSLLAFAYVMFIKVIIPLQKITVSMVLLARQRHKKSINIGINQTLEIQQIIRSMRIFKKNESKRRHIAKSLIQMNKTTLKQLAEITVLQNKSEQKTEQALTLASHLIELQKSAEIDRNNALDNQSRVNMILNTVHDAIITTNKQGIIESINTATELMFGYREAQLIGKNITLLMPTDIAARHPKIMEDFNNQKSPRVDKSSREQDVKHANGTLFPVEIFLGQSEFNHEINYTAIIRDITQRKKDEQAIQHLILTDPLTDLANRRHFNQALKRSIEGKKRLQLSVGLLIIDLDNFKPINDTYGHNVGDKVLQLVSRRLEKVTRNVDLIARLGGDEFAIILNSVDGQFDPITPAKKILQVLSKPMNIDDQVMKIGATIGIAISPQDGVTEEEFVNHADKALYKAKSLGKGQYCLYQDLDQHEK